MSNLASVMPHRYTEAQAAAYLGKSVAFLRKERAAGRISFTRIGKTPFYLDKHLTQYLERNEQSCHDFLNLENM